MNPIMTIKAELRTARFRYSTATILYAVQACKCFYCNDYMRAYSFNHEKVSRLDGYTIDHLFPRTLGYGLAGNAVLACRSCNAKKDSRLPTFVEIVKAWVLYNKMHIPFVASITFP